METYKEIERSIIKKFRPAIWSKFMRAIKDYNLISPGDKIAVCISGGKDSALLAKCMEEVQKHGNVKFELEYIVMDPGYTKEVLAKIKENLRILNIDAHIFRTEIFKIADISKAKSPCFLCATNVIQGHSLMNYATVATDGYPISEENPEVLFSQGSLNIMKNIQGVAGDFGVSYDLYNLYLDEDYRKQLYFTNLYDVDEETTINSDSLGLRKYNRTLQRSYVSDIFTLRVAEAYLNAAEAYAMQNKEQEALNLLNELRSNRIMNYTSQTYTQAGLVQQIRDERRRELCFEGHRWFDLRRYAVCETYPFVKSIARNFAVYNETTMMLRYVEIYLLRPNDPAYTFQIPKAVTDFDTGMEVNPREQRVLSGYLDLEDDNGE